MVSSKSDEPVNLTMGRNMFEYELEQLKKKSLFRSLMVMDSAGGASVMMNGRKMLNMCSNDYLGLAQHPALRKAAASAMEQYGFGSGASRLISGTSTLHQELEEKIAHFKNTDAALLFNSGYAANTGIIPVLAGPGDIIVSDSLNHASIIDGCRLSKADVLVYAHRNTDQVESILKKNHHARRKLIVTDGVFSMDGDIAPLPDLALVAERYGAILMVDDAHATGVLGISGRGSVQHFGLNGRVPVQMGTLGKALGSFGAFVAASREIVDLLINRSRSFMYSTSLPPAVCAASSAALDIVEQEPERRATLTRNVHRFAAGLRKHLMVELNTLSPILPLVLGDDERAVRISRALYERGIYATAIRPPSVPEGTSRLRFTMTAEHQEHDIDHAVEVISSCLTSEGS